MSIKINNLLKKYGSQVALNNIDINFDANTTIGLLGPNGAGKSTLMNCITGGLKYDSGIVEILGKSQKEEFQYLKSQIGFLPENNPLYPEMYVKEYLTFIANIHKINTSEISNTIERVGLGKEQHKKIKQLSKGYKQRVGLAQAIIHDPKILILDEPTNGLDPNQILEIRQLILDLAKNKTVILSTHIMQEVEALCARVVLINNGNIIQDLPIDDFKGKYDNLEQAFYNYTHNV